MPPIDWDDPEVQKAVSDKVAEEAKKLVETQASGIKQKNNELIEEKRKLQTKLEAYKDVDPDSISELLEFKNKFENNEDAKLIADGKIDEVVGKRTEKLRATYEEQLNSAREELKSNKDTVEGLQTKFDNYKIRDALRSAALAAGVEKTAVDDVINRGSGTFSVDSDGSIVARDAEGNLRTTEEGGVLSPKAFIESLKEEAPHFWPPSKSGNLRGGKGGELSEDNLLKTAESGDMKNYRKVREDQKKAAEAS